MRRLSRILLPPAAIIALAACGSPAPAPAQDEEPAAADAATTPGPDAALTAAIEAGEQQAISQLPAGVGRGVISEACLTCHDAAIIQMQRKNRDRWVRSVRQMVEWGAALSAEQEQVAIDYLVEHFGPEPAAAP